MNIRPKKLLTQNSELKPDGIFNWTLPAFGVTLTNGTNMNVCPQAGACASFCYARSGTYNFSNVKRRHIQNLEYILEDPDGWFEQMLGEVQKPKMIGKHIRIHDAGDFFSKDYLQLWIKIAELTPDVTFYCYTKEVTLFKQTEFPSNFKYLFSMGGKEDHLIDLENDRHAEVFKDDAAILDAGYGNQDASDLLAITLPTNKIGIPANNIKHFNKKMAGRTFGELQKERDDKKLKKMENA
jgi:Gene product 88